MDLLDASIGDIAVRLRELLAEQRGAAAASAVSGDGLLEAVHAWEEIGRASDAARAWVAAEVEHESRRELEGSGLAYRHGFASAKTLVAATANISERTAGGRMAVGRQVRSSLSPTGLPLPSRFPAVERALFAGQVGVDAASIICRTLSEVVSHVAWSEAVDEAEQRLVEAATETFGEADTDGLLTPRYTVDELARLAARIREHLDPDGVEPRDAVKQQLRGFSHPRVGADGMARGRYALPPLQLGVFLAAIDSILSPRTADPDAPGGGSGGTGVGGAAGLNGAGDLSGAAGPSGSADPEGVAVVDSRTAEQKLLDAVMALIELAAASPAASRLNGSAPTINVHVTASDLEAGSGVGWIDGSTEPIPMSTIQMLGCDAELTANVFGAAGQVLSQGKSQRLASRRQRRALAARDGGCVIPGCTAPPSRCQAHHVVPWTSSSFLAGRTDIDNLALLCPFHHATIHTSAWQLVMIHGKPHVREPGWRGRQNPARAAGQQRVGGPW
ncbi:DUF222 domain-containing protein [Agreia pratensis]|uniref:HNH endonuclease signature motif containing protein n=1 Tax=Agreia pratensis TaxID=150121 RepID=UPI00188D968A|nr:HNH endonuclease signature motif containing protein [Agreia pratensis]MBF4635127.1 DUF222 domain-containing protein [Agreia pratensis]